MSRRIVILGAGISGLTAAWKITQTDPEAEIIILEKSSRAGGWIQTIHKDGFLFEQGPRSCRSSGAGVDTLKLIEELGLQDKVITADPSASTRFLYIDKKLRKVPAGLWFMGKALLSGVFRDLRTPARKEDESIYDFFSRRFNSEIAEGLIDPLVSGIYAGDIRQLSMRTCFSSICQLEKNYGSVIKGLILKPKPKDVLTPFIRQIQKAPLFSFKGGMEELVKALSDRLETAIRYQTTAISIEYQEKGVVLNLNDGTRLFADRVVSTLPHPDLNYATVIAVNLGYRKPLLKQKGFGYLIPSNQNESILGCVWDSSVFPEQGKKDETRLTVMMGGAHHPDCGDWSEGKILQRTLEAVSRHMGIDALPDAINIKKAIKAIPQYPVGFLEKNEAFKKTLPQKLTWIGSAAGNISVNDCIAQTQCQKL